LEVGGWLRERRDQQGALRLRRGIGPIRVVHCYIEWGRRVCGGLSSTLGIAWCGRSAGCVLGALLAVSAAVLGGGGYPVGVAYHHFF